MSDSKDKAENDKKRAADKREAGKASAKRFKDIVKTAVFASLATLLLFTATGWLTTQKVVEDARAAGEEKLVTLRADLCIGKFDLRADALAKREEFKALSWAEKEDVAQKFVSDEGLATIMGQDDPAPGAIANCADGILRS